MESSSTQKIKIMEYSSTKKITILVDKKFIKSAGFYLIYDMDFQNQDKFKRPEKHFIKILLYFSISSDGQYIIIDFGIPELSFPGILSSYIFNIYSCFSFTDSTQTDIITQKSQKIVHSNVYKLNIAESIHVKLPIAPFFYDKRQIDKFSQIPVECIFSIVPFTFPYFKPQLRLLPTMLFSFINIIPQITHYHSIWPLISWFCQMQYSNDASVYSLYDILFPDKEIDLSIISQGLKRQKKNQRYSKYQSNQNLISSVLYDSPPITDASFDKPGLTYSQLKKIILKITKLISLELGFSYHFFSIEPHYDMKIQESPELVVFCPTFGIKGTILTEILINNKLYILHSAVREEEGNITATVYSPFTKILYDIRNGQIFPLNHRQIPIFHVNEQYIMLLYVHQDVNNFLSQKVQPISTFLGRYPFVNVYNCKIGEKVPLESHKAESISLDYDNEHVYFPYDQESMPYPSSPLEEVCGKSVLQFEVKNFLSLNMVVWHARRESVASENDDHQSLVNPCNIYFVPVAHPIGEGHDLINDNPTSTFAIIQDHCIVAVFSSKSGENSQIEKIKKSLPMNDIVCFEKEVLEYTNDGTCTKLMTITFTRNEKSDKYIKFVGNPILLLIDDQSNFDSILSDLKVLHDFDNVYIKQKSAWAEVNNSEDFYNAARTMKSIDILIQLK